MISSQINNIVKEVTCDSCGTKILFEAAIPIVRSNGFDAKFSNVAKHILLFFCSKNCVILKQDSVV
jgi:hypothetical protein